MYTNEVNTRDLYFSNPLEHFTSQQSSNKTRKESGISSSFSGCNQNGNSMDLQYTNSQDLFSPFDRSSSPFEGSNAGFQKYISQSLILGKDASSKSIYSFKEEKEKKEKEASLTKENKDMKKFTDAIHESIKQLSSEFSHCLKEEVSQINEKIASVEESIGKKVDMIYENCKFLISQTKKEVLDTFSETKELVVDLEKKINEHTEHNEKKLQNITKTFKSLDASNRKQSQDIEALNSMIETSIEKMETLVDTSLKDIQSKFDEVLEKKISNLKNDILKSNQQLVPYQEEQQTALPLNQKENTFLQKERVFQNDSKERKYQIPMSMKNYNPRFNVQHQNIARPDITNRADQRRMIYTPLAQFLNKDEKSYEPKIERNDAYRLKSPSIISEVSETKSYVARLNIKRKHSTTPLRKVISPFLAPPQQRTNPYGPPQNKKRNNASNWSAFQRNNTNFYRKNFDFDRNSKMHSSMNSSPGLSVYQAKNLTKQYATHY